MKLTSVTDLSQVRFDSSEAIRNTNTSVSEEYRAADKITYIPWEDMKHQVSIGKDGKEFSVPIGYYKMNNENLTRDYMDVFSSKAQGKDVSNYEYYVKNFITDITKDFSDSSSVKNDEVSIEKGVGDLVSEMQENKSLGISNEIGNLKTKFSVNGVDFTIKELMDSKKTMDYATSMIPTTGSGLDYMNFGDMGIAKGKVRTFAEQNLNKEQQDLLNSTISARVEKIINSVPEKVNPNYLKDKIIDENNKFYSIKNTQAATNTEYARKIMDTFENVDYTDIDSFKKASQEYRRLIKPVCESFGVINIGRNQALTDVINYEINRFEKFYDESYQRVYLTPDEFKEKIRTAKNVIDIYS
ncbi:hypothetical protein bsdtb5_08900 [Anaeromicropila herbilytica]|uniref:Uncharacterized protein n=2 Tax=Anaeromicropila herbilytica TaxID=2785025 RepID=A0A7R7EIW7_9FIRM|nr:hypothetical protein bsdtb5_08900 [Anaeromicropila herbilytica]